MEYNMEFLMETMEFDITAHFWIAGSFRYEFLVTEVVWYRCRTSWYRDNTRLVQVQNELVSRQYQVGPFQVGPRFGFGF